MKWFQNGLAKMRIIEITKQYIASDSNIANPTNSVRVIVCPASGCCAIELKAVEIDFPWPNAGIIHPIPVVTPAVMMETIAIKDELSIIIYFYCITFFRFTLFDSDSWVAAAMYTVAKMLKI